VAMVILGFVAGVCERVLKRKVETSVNKA
jgi:hypothetical protein